MSLRNTRDFQTKMEISVVEHEIQRIKADLEFFQTQGMLLRQEIKNKEERQEQLINRLHMTLSKEDQNGQL